MNEINVRMPQELMSTTQASQSKGFHVLTRAMRAQRVGGGGGRHGMVFAHAATTGEVDPLTDLDSRLFVGLRP